jgi:hypothetical protein
VTTAAVAAHIAKFATQRFVLAVAMNARPAINLLANTA